MFFCSLIIITDNFYICDPLWEKYIYTQTLKLDLLASKESTKFVFSNDVILALVAAFGFAP